MIVSFCNKYLPSFMYKACILTKLWALDTFISLGLGQAVARRKHVYHLKLHNTKLYISELVQ